MESFHFERMSNVDLHQFHLPASRLSPAKSSSSIVDQFSHHQHGKGDSAYSSFSGGSTAPDYPSPLQPDDLQSSSFSHCVDLKYVKSIYNPAQVLHSDSNTMDQLYRSVEAISQQYRNNTSNKLKHAVKHHNNNVNISSHINKKPLAKQEVHLGGASQVVHTSVGPPPVPTRLDSFIATKNLENSKVHCYNPEIQPQQPHLQQQPRLNNVPHPQLHAPRSEAAVLDTGNLSCNSKPAYPARRASMPQGQHPPSYRFHLRDQTGVSLSPEKHFTTDNKSASEQRLSNIINQSSPQGTSQLEHPNLGPPSSSQALNGDNRCRSSHFESGCKRAHSAYDLLSSDPTRVSRPRNAGQSFISSSIQHKGQFYFVTGVCKLSESGLRTHSATVCGSEAASEHSTVLETYQLREKKRCHSTMDNLFMTFQESSHSSSEIPDEKKNYTSVSEYSDLSSRSQDHENHRLSLNSSQSCQSPDPLEEINTMQCREIGCHTANNAIFYCGPEKNCPPPSDPQKNEVISLMSNEQPNHQKRGKQHPLHDFASDKINKETTPLLYHLTGASRTVLQTKKSTDFSIKGKEMIPNKIVYGDLTVNNKESHPKSDTRKNDREEVISACNTLDDSFKKYYKERLKDAQSKVLNETSFKRRDLQLSRSHQVRQKSELRPTVIHTFFSSQDSETSTDTLTPSVTSEDTERGSIKEVLREIQEEKDKQNEKENRTANLAQPQVARIGGRKRLTQDQKKMCYSEPENLNLVGGGAPVHSSYHSFGNESDNVFAVEYEGKERVQHGEQGLVASRRKLFETRDHTFLASSTSKTSLKHLQHKALMEYMERKTGQKVAEPQQPASQVLPPPRQRHSLGEKPFDWAPRPFMGNHDDKKSKSKLHRPHSAGRILDSSTSSIRYAQFFSAQSASDQYAGQSSKPRLRESRGPTQGKSASVENLLDQQNPPSVFRNRSTSTPYTFECLEAHYNEKDPLPVISMETLSSQKTTVQDPLIKQAPEGQQRVPRVVAPRVKSMEELGALKLRRPSALSKSSEQLDQLQRCSTERVGPVTENSDVLFFSEFREGHLQDREKTKQNVTEAAAKEPETVVQKSTQGHTQNQTKKIPVQNSEPGEITGLDSRNYSTSNSPSTLSSRARAHSELDSPISDEFRSNPLISETPSNPPSPKGLDGEMELKSSTSTPIQTEHLCENSPNFSVGAPSSMTGSERKHLVDEPSNDSPPPDPNNEVSLSCGITTDPSLWILPSDKENKDAVGTSPLTDTVFDDASPSTVAAAQTSEAFVSSCMSVFDKDVTQQVEEEKNRENGDMKSVENEEMEERETPEGEMKNLERPSERPHWDELVETVVKADQSLARVFYPLANRKTALMLMEQLLSEDTLLMEEHYKKKQEQKGAVESPEIAEWTESSSCTSVPDNAKPHCIDRQSNVDITEKRHLLVSCIEAHLRSLEEMRGPLQTDIEENVALGEALEVLVHERCHPVELERYNLFIGDLERVVSLLLCLSARLARVQNALSNVDQHTDAEEKQSLDSRHRLLCKQREDAKDLKDNLDRRENLVSNFLTRQLTSDQLKDYRRFVQTKASLLIRQKDLEEKQKLGEERLEALSNRLIL
ncbi:protein Shroom1 isoform X1 [Antennarius striatus]|uniref:protein Shroom1 isoform X1 n=1 Tax=Antennarius striatus TaxID=241820 RepID=UPI0035B06E4C